MIFFGTRGKTVEGQVVEGLECPGCGQKKHLMFGILRYFHVYWIPMFPTSKSAGLQCLHCKHTLTDKEMPTEAAEEIKAAVFTTRKLVPMFTGIILLAMVMVGGYVAAQVDTRNEAVYIQRPMVNDIYLVNFAKFFDGADKTYKYGIMKINAINGDEIELLISTIGYKKTAGPRQDIRNGKVNSQQYYHGEKVTVGFDAIKSMKKEGTIYSVERI